MPDPSIERTSCAFYPAVGYVDVGATQYWIQGQAYENRIFAKRLSTHAGESK